MMLVSRVAINFLFVAAATVAQQPSQPQQATPDATYVQQNWSSATAVGEPIETQYYPAYFMDFSPCACDLTPSGCDPTCCCDNKCDASTKTNVFRNCTETEMQLRSYSQVDVSGALAQFSQHLQILLHPQYVTTPHLGYFYASPISVRTATIYSQVASAVEVSVQKLSDQNPSKIEPLIQTGSQSGPYQLGAAVRYNDNYLDSLPSPVMYSDGGPCTFRSPARFLHSSNWTCTVTITDTSCTENTMISLYSYLFRVYETSSFSSTLVPLSNASTGIPLLPQIATETSTGSTVMHIGSRRVFKCGNKASFAGGDCQPMGDVEDIDAAPSSSNDGICHNVAYAVSNKYFWAGNQIVDIERQVFLIDARIGESVTQSFSVQWIHKSSGVQMSSNRTTARNGQYNSWYGYRMSDVISSIEGNFSRNDFTASALISTANAKPVPILVSNGISNECDANVFDVRRTKKSSPNATVTFGQNVESSCFLRLTKQSFANCERLREEMQERWRVFYSGLEFITKTFVDSSRPTFLLVDDLVQVHVETRNTKVSSTNQVLSTTYTPIMETESNRSLAEEYLALLREAERLRNNGTVDSSGRKTAQNSRVVRVLPRWYCDNIPVRSRLEIMYAEVGFLNGTYMNAIIGASISFDETIWRYSSFFAESQNYLLTTSVRFYKVPPREAAPVKSYYLKERRDHCPSAITCWDELFYPFLDWFPGEMYRYTQAVGLASLLAAGGVYTVTRPWW